MKKTIAILLSLMLMLSTFSFTAFASSQSGTCGENLTWTLDPYGLLTVTGTGDMDEYSVNGTPWNSYKKNIKKVIVADGVTSIGKYAFSFCINLEKVSIYEDVAYIGPYAFYYCSSLTAVEIPDSVTYIGDHTFDECSKLSDITIGDSVEYFGISMFDKTAFFQDQSNWEDGLLYVGKYLVKGNPEVTDGNFKEGTRLVASLAFTNCPNITEVNIPDSVAYVREYAFSYCEGLSSVTIGKNVKSIEMHAFEDCQKLTTVTVLGAETLIGEYAFGYYFGNNGYTKIEGFTVKGMKGSLAEKYAISNGLAFVALDGESLPDSESDEFMDDSLSTMPNVNADTTVEDMILKLSDYGINATVTDKDGIVLEKEDLVGTGCKVITSDEKAYTVIVKGDVDGTGTVDSADYLKVKSSFLGDTALIDEYLKAADCDNDGELSATDYLNIKGYFLGNVDLYA